MNKCFNFLPFFFFLLLEGGCKNEVKEQYYSLEKSHYGNSYGELSDEFNFYKFQEYLVSVRKDSIYIDNYTYNFDDSLIYGFLKKIYSDKGYDDNVQLLNRVGKLNSGNYRDSNIIVLDIYEDVSLLCLSPIFNIYPLGTCCSPYQNFLIQKSKDSITILHELHSAQLLGVFVNDSKRISGLFFQGYSNSHGDFKGLNASYNFRYQVSEEGLICDKIENVRNGEPFDDKDPSDYEVPEKIKFREKHHLTTYSTR